ncbi:signal peptidase II [Longimicrobium sp.]|uniref:signal peptidase II n=1 Tax=Longimicrobium sp. TaxID=2029185 RepID=UPI002BA610B6|nr:signal peptidase II [Longimicrobium sp.]HSU12665.1 signal peptidase II [Longimicrobium sp.]
MKLYRRRWLALALFAVVAADWFTKFLVQNHIHLYGQRPVIDGWLWLAHARNPGIAFSFAQGLPEYLRLPLLVAAASIGIAVAARIAQQTRDSLVRLAAVLIMAGALGNLGDRVMNGWVTDFIQVRWFPFIFNVADMAITIGAVMLAVRMIFAAEPPHGPAAPAEG